jgi:hypothetical protein
MPSSGSWSWGQSGSMSASTRVRSKVRSKGSAEQAPISKGWAQQAAALSTESTHTHTQSTSASQRHHHVRPCSHADSDWSSEDGRGSADAFLADSNAVNSWHPSHVTSWSHVPCALTRQAWSQSSAEDGGAGVVSDLAAAPARRLAQQQRVLPACRALAHQGGVLEATGPWLHQDIDAQLQAAEELLNSTSPSPVDTSETAPFATHGVPSTLPQRGRGKEGGCSRQISARVMEEEYKRVLMDVMDACQLDPALNSGY